MADEFLLDPFLPQPDYLIPAWFSCLRYMLGRADVVAAFRADTGNQYYPDRTGIGRMIDQATGAGADFVRAFATWFNVNIWGQ